MKLKKLFCSILAFAMVISTMNFTVLANYAEPEAVEVDMVSVASDEYPTESWMDVADTDWYVAGNDSYTISSAAELAGLAKLVNDGTAFASGAFNNTVITLDADIDLAGKMWTPIGGGEANKTFAGIFDGNNKTISNVIVISSYSNIGLFGRCAENADFGVSAEVKDLTVNNAIVKCQSADAVGAVVGYGHTELKVDNVNVTGALDIDGYRGVAAVVGKGYADIYNSTVNAEGTIHSAFWCAGGIIGHSDEPVVTIEGCSVSGTAGGLTIDGGSYNGAGGIAGYIAGGSTIKDVFVDNVTIEGNSYYYGGLVAGNGYNNTVNGSAANVVFKAGDEIVTPGDENAITVKTAKIGDTYYNTLQEAFDAVEEGETINLCKGTFEVGTVKMPSTLKNVTLKGADDKGSVLKDSKIMTPDGNEYTIDGLTVDGVVFDNSRITLTGWRVGAAGANLSNLTVTNCEFINIDDTTGEAALHINMAAEEAVNGFTFTNNVIDGAIGGSKSGVYAQVTGEAVFTGNIINNVAFRPYIIQITIDDGIADTFTVTDNTFSGSAQGRAQALGNVENIEDGTDNVTLVVSENIFTDITSSQQICYWNFNDDYTIADISRNYYDIDLEKRPNRIYYNNAAGNVEDLIDMGVYPVYKGLTDDGELDPETLYVPDIAVAQIGNDYYTSLQEAVDAAASGDTIVVLQDIEAVVNPNEGLPSGQWNLAADSTNNDKNTLIHTDADDVITLDLNGKTISAVGSDEAEYDVLAIRNHGNLTIMDSSAEKTGTVTLSFNGTKEYQTSQIHSTILNFGTLTVDGGNIKNTATTGYGKYAIHNYSWGGNAILTINGGKISCDNSCAVFASAYDDFSKNECSITVAGGVIDGGLWYTSTGYTAKANVNITDGEFIAGKNPALTIKDASSPAVAVIASVSGGNYTGDVNASNVDNFISGGTYTNDVTGYCAEGFKAVRSANNYSVVAADEEPTAETISVEYKDITAADAEESKTYEIVVKANDDDVINELASVDLTFDLTKTPVGAGAMSFTILPAADFTLSQTGKEGEENRYMFNYNGTTAFEGTGNEIVIGTITVDGFGSYTIATADVATNIVNATTVNDNLVDYYVADGATDDDATTGGLVINEDTVADDGLVGEITDGEITIPTRSLTINIDFPNAVVDNDAAAYQDMTVTVVGGTYEETFALGENGVAMVDGAYIISEDLAYNTTYTVTVEGAGYRTARYSVVLTDDKVLNFWNNAMDEAQVVEIGKDSSKVRVTFLAGDIVKDNNINIYDLSAVVSYFGAENLVSEHPEYAKYDLNRDGLIDSKDVAYVLVSWNE